MLEESMEFNLYRDIKERTRGEIYIGVVGPVRTGKSTFIKRFMELCVLPFMEDENVKVRTTDELPQSAQGKTVMTTEPKFVPAKAATIKLDEENEVSVRLIDCVGYMVDGAVGHMEDGAERMVKTPWFDYEIPFTQAAELGTRKVIDEHSTLGIVMTTDGSFTEIPRENYEMPEEKTVAELKKYGKPFLIVLNSQKPYSEATRKLAAALAEKYQVTVLPLNCQQLREEDVQNLLQKLLYEFPVSRVEFEIPRWTQLLPLDHKIKKCLIEQAGNILNQFTLIKNAVDFKAPAETEYITGTQLSNIDLSHGVVKMQMTLDDKYYYENISEMTGVTITEEYQLIQMIRHLAEKKREYDAVADAMHAVKMKGYGVVIPPLQDVELAEPELIRSGNKYGVKMKAQSPSIHMIKANIETEIAPIVGSEQQAQDLISYINESRRTEEGIWSTNIFGKSIGELVEDGMRSKISMMDDESQVKLQETMQKIVNDSTGGMVCIII